MRRYLGTVVAIALTAAVVFALAFGGRELLPSLASDPKDCSGRLYSATDRISQCLAATAGKAVEKDGLTKGIGRVEGAAFTNQDLQIRCHLAMHTAGREWAAEQGGDFAGSMEDLAKASSASQGADCYGGFMHGAILEARKSLASDKSADGEQQVCPPLPLMARQACEHGFGHAFMRGSGFDLEKSLELCDSFNDERISRNCWGGVFMEHSFAYHGLDGTDADGLDSLEKVCEEVDDTYVNACVTWAVTEVPTAKRAMDVCGQAIDQGKFLCVVASNMRTTPYDERALCSDFEQGAHRPACEFGNAARAGLAHAGDGDKGIVDICLRHTDDALQAACAAGVGFARRFREPEESTPESVCEGIEEQLVKGCRIGAAQAEGPVPFL